MFGTKSWNHYGRIFFDPDGDGGGGGASGQGNGGGEQPPAGDPDPLAGLSEDARKAVQRQIDRAAATARKQAEADARTKFEQDAEAKRKADEEERERQAAIARGEFDKVKTDLETKLAAIEAEKTGATERLAAYETALSPLIESTKADLEKIGAETLKGYPEQADAVTRLAWLQDRRELVKALRPDDAAAAPKVPATPRPNGAPASDPNRDEAARRRAARAYTG